MHEEFDLNIVQIRGVAVVLDRDLASVYGVETRVFNQAFKRNRDRFPQEFAFQVTDDEWDALRSQIVILKAGGRGAQSKYRPWVFTEHGALMSATILNSPKAISMSVFIIRSFVKQRETLSTNETILKRLAEIDKSLLVHDAALGDLYQKLLPLLTPPPAKSKRLIGFGEQS